MRGRSAPGTDGRGSVNDLGLQFDNSYSRELEGFFERIRCAEAPAPRLVRLNHPLARSLGMDPDSVDRDMLARQLSAGEPPADSDPLAMVYAGHQFGAFSPQLGDGRALLLGEVVDTGGVRRDIHLKGTGPTSFSRGGDGKAVLGPVLREYLVSEAMHALGIPATRALAALTTGETVMREQPLPGAILARVARSHLRVGSFQYFAARRDNVRLRRLADYAIRRHHPDIVKEEDRWLLFFERVVSAQASLIAKWILAGFVHGVMNTDNMAISGETIDFGPCAFIDAFDQAALFSSIDEGGRYAFGNQPAIAQWNLARFAETLVPLVDPDDPDRAVERLTEALGGFAGLYVDAWLSGMRAKLGLAGEEEGDLALAHGLVKMLDGKGIDYTLFFRRLAPASTGRTDSVRSMFADPGFFDEWFDLYLERIELEDQDAQARLALMNRTNPLYIPRNHKVEEALAAAVEGDLCPFDRLLEAVTSPYEERRGLTEFAEPAPAAFGPYRTFCGT
ncbi:MAG: YdiU family protein [Geminicoccaceae bacterium]|nr:YdiU family protein [Geminicoccaceae bacterium]